MVQPKGIEPSVLQGATGLQPVERHRSRTAKWRIAKKFNLHPEGALVFKTSRRSVGRTIQARFPGGRMIFYAGKNGGRLTNRRPVLSHAACFRNKMGTFPGTVLIIPVVETFSNAQVKNSKHLQQPQNHSNDYNDV